MNAEEILPRELTSPVPRRGKWTPEEERYTEKIIFDFEHGTLDVPEGTTLRTLLSKVLNCDPMRITKKYTGNSSIGKRTFVPLVRTPENSIFMDMSQQDLRELRAVWINKLLLMEQWNNRKINLMKAHIGAGSAYEAHNPSGYNGSSSGEEGLFAVKTVKPEHGLGAYGATNPTSVGPSSSTVLDANGGAAQFQEVALRLTLEPHVASLSEMDHLIKWLKTLFYVLVDRTISTTDLEHSLFVGSISLPALLAIHRSRCVQGKPRLDQVHTAIDAYLKKLGAQLAQRGADSSSASRPLALQAPAGTGGADSDAGGSDSDQGSVAEGLLLSSLSAMKNAPIPADLGGVGGVGGLPATFLATANAVSDAESTATAVTSSAASTVSPRAARVDAGVRPASEQESRSGSGAVSLPEIESTIRSQTIFSQLPEHLRAYLTEVSTATGVGAGASSNSAAGAAIVTGAAGESTAVTSYPGHLGSGISTGAHYQAQVQAQALTFAQHQARALATAQAQAKALAASYRYPASKRNVNSVAKPNGGLSELDAAKARAAEEAAEREDHLMQFHMALVQSLAAERSAKKGGSPSLSRQRSGQGQALGQSQPSAAQRSVSGTKTGGRGYGLASSATGAATTTTTATATTVSTTAQLHSQKRRKLTEYTDMYMDAMQRQHQNQSAALAAGIMIRGVSSGGINTSNLVAAQHPTYEQQYAMHQRRMAAEDADTDYLAAGSTAGLGGGMYPPLPPQQLHLLASLKEIYPDMKAPGVAAATSTTANTVTVAGQVGTAGARTPTPPADAAMNECIETSSNCSTNGGSDYGKPVAPPSAPVNTMPAAVATSTVPTPATATSTAIAAAAQSVKSATTAAAPSAVSGLGSAGSALSGASLPMLSTSAYQYLMGSPPDATYAYHSQLYGGWSPYGTTAAGYGATGLTGSMGLLPPAMATGGPLPAGLQGLSHAQILQYMATIPSGTFSAGQLVPGLSAPLSQPPTGVDSNIGSGKTSAGSSGSAAGAASSNGSAGSAGKLTLDEWLRVMQQCGPRTGPAAGATPSVAAPNPMTASGLSGYSPMYTDPSYLMMMSQRYPAQSSQSPAQYLSSLYSQQAASAAALYPPYYTATSPLGLGGGLGTAAGYLNPADMQTYSALLSAAHSVSPPPQLQPPALSTNTGTGAGTGLGQGTQASGALKPTTGSGSGPQAAAVAASVPSDTPSSLTSGTTNANSNANTSSNSNTSSGNISSNNSTEGISGGGALTSQGGTEPESLSGGHSAAAEALIRLLNN